MRIRTPISWRRQRRYSPTTDQLEPLRRFIFLNIGRDTRICFAHWGVALTVRFGVGYA